jgi:hypothetical protein
MSYKAARNWLFAHFQSGGAAYIILVVAAGLFVSLKSQEPEIGVMSLLLAAGSSMLVLSEFRHPKKRKILRSPKKVDQSR